MGFPTCKLEDLTGPLGGPDRVILSIVDQNDNRFEIRRLQMERNDELQQNLFEFDRTDLIPFQNPVQLRLGLNAADGQDLGSVIIDPADAGKDELTQKFGPGPRLFELTYGVLPG
jgi:hypothetical protein